MILCRPYVDLYQWEVARTRSLLDFIKKYDPSIEYLELVALCARIFTWVEQLKDCRIQIFCDNQAVVSMVNNMTLGCKNCMVLLRLLVLHNLYYKRRV